MLELRRGSTSSSAVKGRSEKTLTVSLIVTVGIAAALTILYATVWGPWAGSDSVEYLEAARNLAGGQGLVTIRASGHVEPIYARPPLYSIILASTIRLGLDRVASVRWLNVALIVALIGVVGVSFFHATARLMAPVLASLFLLADVAVLDSFPGLMTEPLFILIVTGQLVSLAAYLANRKAWTLWLSAVLAGLALLTRYAGAACILVLAAAVVGWGEGTLGKRLRLAMAASLVAALPFLIWTGSLLAHGDTPGVYRLDLATLRQAFGSARVSMLNAAWGWFPWLQPAMAFAYRVRLALTVGFLAVGAGALLWFARKRGDLAGRGAPGTLLLGVVFAAFSLVHAGVVSLAYVLVEFPRPALNERVLLPSHVTFVLGLVLLGWYLLSPLASQRPASILILVLIVPLVLPSIRPARALLAALHADGRGYTGRAWDDLPILTRLDELPRSAPLITNDIDAVTFFARRPAFRLPDLDERIAETQWRPFGETRERLAEREFADKDGYLVLFPSALGQLTDVYGNQADARLDSLVEGLQVVYEGSDGAIYTR